MSKLSVRRLSICIPTFNRGAYLEELLTSVLVAASARNLTQIEICISDNASTDGTEAIVRRWQIEGQYPMIYRRQDVNQGADRNYMAAAALSTADFIWFMGSDDAFREGAIDKLLLELTEDCILGVCGRMEADSAMRPLFPIHWLANTSSNRLFDLSKRDVRLDYLNRCRSIGGVFSYLSSVVVSRKAWAAARLDESYLGGAYPHAYICLRIFEGCSSAQPCSLLFIREPLVNNRTGNDHFAADGNVNRVLIDLRAYTRLADDVFAKDSDERSALIRVLAREWPPVHTTFFMAKNARSDQWAEAVPYLLRIGAPRLLVGLLGRSPSIAKALSSPFVRKLSHSFLGRKR